MSSRFASLHSGLLIRERAPAPSVLLAAPAVVPQPPSTVPPPAGQGAVIRPFPFAPAAAPPRAAEPPQPAPAEAAPAQPARTGRRRSFTLRLDDKQHLLLQIAKTRFGLSGQRLLVRALEALLGRGG
jgi:hypothetical protein